MPARSSSDDVLVDLAPGHQPRRTEATRQFLCRSALVSVVMPPRHYREVVAVRDVSYAPDQHITNSAASD